MQSFPYPKLELKYCERCGGLWLRPQGGEAVYCARCAEAIAELPPVTSRGGGGPIQAAYATIVAALGTLFDLAGQIGGAVA